MWTPQHTTHFLGYSNTLYSQSQTELQPFSSPFPLYSRHPMASKRPSFSEVCDYLNASDDLLLNWTSQDKMVSERVTEIGAPHSEARNLYPDLQYTYDTSQMH